MNSERSALMATALAERRRAERRLYVSWAIMMIGLCGPAACKSMYIIGVFHLVYSVHGSRQNPPASEAGHGYALLFRTSARAL